MLRVIQPRSQEFIIMPICGFTRYNAGKVKKKTREAHKKETAKGEARGNSLVEVLQQEAPKKSKNSARLGQHHVCALKFFYHLSLGKEGIKLVEVLLNSIVFFDCVK